MLHLIKSKVYEAIWRYGDLKPKDAAKAMGREHQLANRIMSGKQMPSPEQETLLAKKVGLSIPVFVEIMCRVLTEFLDDGRRVTIVPRGQHLPISPVVRAGDLFDLHHEKLSSAQRERVKSMLDQARLTDALAGQTCEVLAKEVRTIIEEALAARGERLPDD